ncbi:protein AMN1 homolog isoform X2 [Engraulis encrasicolus]|uniref:protein AMN1 homolog isoform X2 n=1 Tax=Engraulis encrasicolus TaxID=184585 RepID=UPI002FD3B487
MKVESLLDIVDYVARCADNLGGLGDLPPHIKCKVMRSMTCHGTLTDSNISQVLHPGLKALDIRNCRLTDTALQNICSRHLSWICLSNSTEITSTGLQALASSCPHLRWVNLSGCTSVTDPGIQALAQSCAGLEVIALLRCTALTDGAFQALGANCRMLHTVSFSETQITDTGVIGLATGVCASRLKEIHMSGCTNLTDEAVIFILSNCPNIETFQFHGCPLMTDRAWEALQNYTGKQKFKHVTWTIY